MFRDGDFCRRNLYTYTFHEMLFCWSQSDKEIRESILMSQKREKYVVRNKKSCIFMPVAYTQKIIFTLILCRHINMYTCNSSTRQRGHGYGYWTRNEVSRPYSRSVMINWRDYLDSKSQPNLHFTLITKSSLSWSCFPLPVLNYLLVTFNFFWILLRFLLRSPS